MRKYHWQYQPPGNLPLSNLITQVASDAILDLAYHWLCKRGKKLSHNNDVWNLRRDWQRIKPDLQRTLLHGEYSFSPQVEVRLPEKNLEYWCALDSLVLKAMAIVLDNHLQPVILPHCVHIKDHGGAKKAVRDVFNNLSSGSHVMKSDVKSYYASIDHMLLFDVLTEYVTDKYVLRILSQYLKRTVRYGENYRDVDKGISLGCSLSSLMAALFLMPLDDLMADSGLFYCRFMDDWIVIAPTRWKLRKAVHQINVCLDGLGLQKHPDKTYIGRTERGFDFLGYHFGPEGLTVAKETWRRFAERAARLYEREPGEPCDPSRFVLYIRRWLRWVRSGGLEMKSVIIRCPSFDYWVAEAATNL